MSAKRGLLSLSKSWLLELVLTDPLEIFFRCSPDWIVLFNALRAGVREENIRGTWPYGAGGSCRHLMALLQLLLV
jgi:hypothetical protein